MNQRLRFAILKRDGFRCCYCGRAPKDGVMLEVDHVHPRSLGGGDDPANLVTACDVCNGGKHAIPLLRSDFGPLTKPGTEARAIATELKGILSDLVSEFPEILQASYEDGLRDGGTDVDEDDAYWTTTKEEVRLLLIRAYRLTVRLT